MILGDITRCADAYDCPSQKICERADTPILNGATYMNFWEDFGNEETGKCCHLLCVDCQSDEIEKRRRMLVCETCGE